MLKEEADTTQLNVSLKESEINILKRLDNQFIIKYYGWFYDDDHEKKKAHLAIVTEYCDVSLNIVIILQRNLRKYNIFCLF